MKSQRALREWGRNFLCEDRAASERAIAVRHIRPRWSARPPSDTLLTHIGRATDSVPPPLSKPQGPKGELELQLTPYVTIEQVCFCVLLPASLLFCAAAWPLLAAPNAPD